MTDPIKRTIPVNVPWRHYMMIGVLASIFVGMIGLSLYTGNRMVTVYTPLADAAMEIKLEVAIAHIWCEELMSGDDDASEAEIHAHLNQAEWYAQAMLKGGSNPEGTFIPLDDPEMRQEMQKLQTQLTSYRELVGSCNPAVAVQATESNDNQPMDKLIVSLIAQADNVETRLQQITSRELTRFRWTQSILLALGLLLGIATGVSFRRFDRRQAAHLNTIEQTNQELQAEVKRRAAAETEALQTAQALRSSEKRYRSLISEMLNGFALHEMIYDDDGKPIDYRFLEMNAAFEQMTGLKTSDCIGKTVLEVMPNTETYWIERYGSVALTGTPVRFEAHAQELDRYYEVQAYRPEPNHFVTVFSDVTARKLAEQALQESEAKYRLLVDNQTDLIVKVGPEGNFQYVSPSYCKLFGKSEDELLGTEFMPAVHQDDREQAIREMENLSRPPHMAYLEQRALTHDGWRWLGWMNTALLDENGAVEGIIAVGRDITERVKADNALETLNAELEDRVEKRTRELRDAQEKLVRGEKLAMLGQLAGSVGHELRNPLGVISNSVYFLKLTQQDANEMTQEYLNTIDGEVRNADKIVRDLLDFGRTRPPDRRTITIAELVQRVLERLPPPEGIQVQPEIPAELPAVSVDPQQIDMVLNNLVTNAYQAMPQGGMLSLSAHLLAEKHAVSLAIRDTGNGIPPENMDKLFEPLFTTKARGIGLGLALCKNLMEANGGDITVQSTPGVGSTFSINLPLA